MRVLVVDDNAVNRLVLRGFLEKLDAEVFEASDGLQGFGAAVEAVPDLILMDLQMPVLDGLEATRKILSCPQTAHIPVLALSAHDEGSSQQINALEAGCMGCIPKPLNFKVLLAAMATVTGTQLQLSPPAGPAKS